MLLMITNAGPVYILLCDQIFYLVKTLLFMVIIKLDYLQHNSRIKASASLGIVLCVLQRSVGNAAY